MTSTEILAQAAAIGTQHGTDAASWAFDGNTTDDRYRGVLAGLDDGDPAVYDSFGNEPSFSGEYAGDYSERALCADLGINYDQSATADVDALADAYLDAARAAYWAEIERVARASVAAADAAADAEVRSYRCPCCGDDVMSSGPVCIDCRAASCEASTDACGETGYWNCQREDDQS